MKYRIMAILMLFILITGNCSAVQFSSLESVGTIVASNIGGFEFRGGIFNKGTLSKYGKGKTVYGSGTARLGNGRDAFYFHYDIGDYKRNIPTTMLFGNESKSNTIPVKLLFANVFKIGSNEDITLYLIHDTYDLEEESWYTLIGNRKDGRWVKYFDTETVRKSFFGKSGDWGLAFYKADIKGDEIIIHYKRNIQGKPLSKNNANEKGEFRFKWDDKAQWFGVEKVVY